MEITVLGKEELENVLEMPAVIDGVQSVYRQKSEGNTVVWPLIEYHFPDKNAVMDIKSGGVFGDINLHGLKMLNSFPMNASEGLPTFTGLLMVFDSNNGIPLGIMDASFITGMRTGAAGAIGVKSLARPDSEVLLMLGAGRQSIFQIAATLILMPKIKKVYIADTMNFENAQVFAASCHEKLLRDFEVDRSYVEFLPVENLGEAAWESDVIITITPSISPVLKKEWVRSGTHISCIGADMVGKEEIDPELFVGSRVYADDIEQCIRVGELEIPTKMGLLSEEEIIGEIGDVLTGKVEGRVSSDDITIFDATGLALLDLATAKIGIELAKQKSLGAKVKI